MQLFKDMEVVLMLVFGVVCAAVFIAPTDLIRATGSARAIAGAESVRAAPAIPTVHVIGRRLAHAATAALPTPTPTLRDGESSVDED